MSGTRLKAKRIVGDDGSSQPQFVWRDTLRNEDCTWYPAEDGTSRCLPIYTATAATMMYSDSACTVRVAALLPAACGPKYILEPVASTGGSCPPTTGGYRMHKPGTQLPTSTAYNKTPEGACVDARNDSSVRLFPLTHVEPSEFVGSTVVVDD